MQPQLYIQITPSLSRRLGRPRHMTLESEESVPLLQCRPAIHSRDAECLRHLSTLACQSCWTGERLIGDINGAYLTLLEGCGLYDTIPAHSA